MPAPIRMTSTPASIAPYSDGSVGSWILASRFMPTRPSWPSLARSTSTKVLSMVSRCRAGVATWRGNGSIRYGVPGGRPAGRK